MKKLAALLSSTKGFSLIELLVSFSIIAVLTGVGFVSFNNYISIQQMSQTAHNVELLINQAKGNAQSRVKIVYDQNGTQKNCNAGVIEAYKVIPDTSTTPDSIRVVLVCSPPPVPDENARIFSLPEGVVLSGDCTTIEFFVLDSTAELNLDPSRASCNIVLTKGSITKTLTIDKSGNTEIL